MQHTKSSMATERKRTNVICWTLISIIFVLISREYWLEIKNPGSGVDILWRVTEARYFLLGINPYEVFTENISVIDSWGKPATYSFISYIFAAALSFLTNKHTILIFYSCIDVFCLFGGVYLINKILNKNLPTISLFTIGITCISLIKLGHLIYLNYGLISIFGLLLVFFAIPRKLNYLIVLGAFLVGLKPSIAILMCIYLIVGKYWRVLFLTTSVYLAIGLLSAHQLDTPLYVLIMQLQKTQEYFSNLGFYRFEGLLLFARPFIGHKMTFVGLMISVAIFMVYRRRIREPMVGVIIIIVLSLSFLFNQEHAWVMAYPIVFFAINAVTQNKLATIPLIILIAFLIVPSNYVAIEAAGYVNYMSYHNIIRFGLLIIAAYWLISYTKKSRCIEDHSSTPLCNPRY